MLEGARDPTGDVEPGTHRRSSLSHLEGAWCESRLDGGSGGCDSTPQMSGELIDEVPVRSIASGPTGHNDFGVAKTDVGPLQTAFQDLDCEVSRLELQS